MKCKNNVLLKFVSDCANALLVKNDRQWITWSSSAKINGQEKGTSYF